MIVDRFEDLKKSANDLIGRISSTDYTVYENPLQVAEDLTKVLDLVRLICDECSILVRKINSDNRRF
jgi:hypothetical protein